MHSPQSSRWIVWIHLENCDLTNWIRTNALHRISQWKLKYSCANVDYVNNNIANAIAALKFINNYANKCAQFLTALNWKVFNYNYYECSNSNAQNSQIFGATYRYTQSMNSKFHLKNSFQQIINMASTFLNYSLSIR